MRKIISIILIITILISCKSVYAFAKIGNVKLEKVRDCEKLLTYKNRVIKTSYIETKIENIAYPCYCINPDLDGVGELGAYEVNVENTLEKDSLIYKAIINGYPYKTLNELGVKNEDEAYTATKQAIYSMIYGRYTDMSDYGKVNTEAGERTLKALNQIVKQALDEKIEECSQEIKALADWKIEDDICYKKYQIIGKNIDSYNIEIEGNVPESLEVKLDKNIFTLEVPIKDMKECVDFIIKANLKTKSKPVLYGKTLKENSQNYAIAGIKLEDFFIEIQDSYDKNNTSLRIIKKDNKTEERLEGVKFQILDEEKLVILDNVKTDKNGEILLENLIPGKYYIREIETLDEYEIHKELVEINIEYDEEKVVEVENIKKEIPDKSDIPKLPKTGF